ncbi:MAG: hypothetical protein HC890_13950 [Chloroflexaceae bacterium]|nr:hypothetical protein [Chloroflexaceae bacterium]
MRNNGGTLTDGVVVDPSRLVAGKNTLTFEFSSTLNGTTSGYEVTAIDVSPLPAAQTPTPPAETASQPQASFANLPLNFFNQPVGTQRSTVFQLADLSQPVGLRITATDIDRAAEARLSVNGQAVALPQGIVQSNGRGVTDTVTLAPEILRSGDNTVTFAFASNLNGTTSGYSIDALAIA